MIALRYQIGEEVHVYIFQKFKGNRKEIERREDAYKDTEIGGMLGTIDFKEFGELCNYVRSEPEDLLLVQEDESGLFEDCESKDPCSVRCDDGLEVNENTY